MCTKFLSNFLCKVSIRENTEILLHIVRLTILSIIQTLKIVLKIWWAGRDESGISDGSQLELF